MDIAEFLDTPPRRAEFPSSACFHVDATGCELLNTTVVKRATLLQYGWPEVLAMTVLLVLVFFAALITMDYMVTRHRLAREAKALASAALPAVEPAWVAGYQMPEALYYHRGHTWARPLDADTVLIGVDDFARKLIGPAATVNTPARGEWLHQGGRAFAMKL